MWWPVPDHMREGAGVSLLQCDNNAFTSLLTLHLPFTLSSHSSPLGTQRAMSDNQAEEKRTSLPPPLLSHHPPPTATPTKSSPIEHPSLTPSTTLLH